jgi:protein subunit release factor B
MTFGVSAAKEAALRRLMAQAGLTEEDIVERFVRSGGPGGQNVNKTATAVYLRHRPTGLEVKAQTARSQALNRFLARRLLAERLAATKAESVSAERARVAKLRRQKNRRSRRAQGKVLQGKKMRAEVKVSRSKPAPDDGSGS